VSDFIPYGRQTVDEHDVAEVANALREPLITQGPGVEAFECAFADAVHARHAVAFSSGTAALHGAVAVCNLTPGEEVLTTPISFVASSNCILYAGGRPRFADIDPSTFNLDAAGALATGAAENIRAVVAVSLTGLPADLEPLQPMRACGVRVIEDACHALGAYRGGQPVGGDGMADLSVFSLHPVKAITTGEGGVVTTDDKALAARLRTFRNHGIVRPPAKASTSCGLSDGGDDSGNCDPNEHATDAHDPLLGPWHYDVTTLGFNYRITDFQCALGHSQLRKLGGFIAVRNRIAARYRELLQKVEGLSLPPSARDGDVHAYHLFVVRFTEGSQRRRLVCERLREENIGTQLHYIPIYRHSLYRSLGYSTRLPHAEQYYQSALSLPIAPAMTEQQVARVAEALRRIMDEPLQLPGGSGDSCREKAVVAPE